jgi:hypothetical protein
MKNLIRELPVTMLACAGALALLMLQATLDAPRSAPECRASGPADPARTALYKASHRPECDSARPRLTAQHPV